jgi:hypothetical protein
MSNRGLKLIHKYVNRIGVAIFLGNDKSTYYCGKEDRLRESRCGPKKGPQCKDCSGLVMESSVELPSSLPIYIEDIEYYRATYKQCIFERLKIPIVEQNNFLTTKLSDFSSEILKSNCGIQRIDESEEPVFDIDPSQCTEGLTKCLSCESRMVPFQSNKIASSVLETKSKLDLLATLTFMHWIQQQDVASYQIPSK